MPGAPLVSVVMPTHRPNPHFGTALESVASQTCRDWELIVVDDGWEEPAQLDQMLQGRGDVRIITHRHAGIARSRNRALAGARGELVAFFDHDDLWRPDHLERMVSLLRAQPGAVAAYGPTATVEGDSNEISGPPEPPASRDDLLAGRLRPNIPSVLARREAVALFGGFEPLLEPADDIDYIYKLGLMSDYAFDPEYTAGWRRHPGNYSGDVMMSAEAHDRVLVLHEGAARQRGDAEGARLLAQNRKSTKRFWSAKAWGETSAALRNGESGKALQLAKWCLRYSPVDFARLSGSMLGHKLGRNGLD
jgi:glycosyltransferase involved in cell wall biosynthesis